MYKSKCLNNFGILREYKSPNKIKYKVTSICNYWQVEEKEHKFTAKGEAGNTSKLDNNLSRAKSRIFELAYCNPWELFVTFTLDKNKYDRENLKKFNKDLSQFIRNYNRKYSLNIKYLLIPEQHQDGCWHMHGFIMGLPISHLKAFSLNEHLPYKILNRIKEGKRVFTWEAYAVKFGFADIEIIENNEASSKYITKYITKDTMKVTRELNAHMFYASKGLNSSVVIVKDLLANSITNPDYSNDYVSCKWFDNFESAVECFEE